MGEQQQAPGTAAEISRRVGAILDAVEDEAARLREEARAEAAAYLDDARRRADALVAERRRRIAELSDELVTKSEAVVARLDDAAPVRYGFENLVRALSDAAERLAREAGGGSGRFASGTDPAGPAADPPVAAGAHPARSPAPPAWRGLGGSSAAPGRREQDEARTVALQMAAAGASRGEVREHLLRSLGLGEGDAVLDEVFGPGSAESARVPWAASRG